MLVVPSLPGFPDSLSTHCQESGDVFLVIHFHGHNILEHPEERTVVTLLGACIIQQMVKLEEEPSCALCIGNSIGKQGSIKTFI